LNVLDALEIGEIRQDVLANHLKLQGLQTHLRLRMASSWATKRS
jgi:hypothetical protein